MIPLSELLATPVALAARRPTGSLERLIENLSAALRSVGIGIMPEIRLGEADFWTVDGTTTINVPWFLATDRLWALAETRRVAPWTTVHAVWRLLLHEAAHAVFYAYRVADDPAARAAFGDFSKPYRDDFRAVQGSRRFAKNLHGIHPSLADYAQKHPEEDWCETFAAWLSRTPVPAEARAKVSAVADIVRRRCQGEPPAARRAAAGATKMPDGTVDEALRA